MTVVYVICCATFYGHFIALELVERTFAFGVIFKEALDVMHDKSRSDDEKELLVQRAAIRAMRESAMLIARLALAFVASALPLAIAIQLGLASAADFSEFALRPTVLVATLLGMTGIEFLRRRFNG